EGDGVGARGQGEGGDGDLPAGGGDFDGCAAVDRRGGLPAGAGGGGLGDRAARALHGAGEGGGRGAAVAEGGGREARRARAGVGERAFGLRGARRGVDRVCDLQRRGRWFFFRFFKDRFAADRHVRSLVDVVGSAGAAGEADVDLFRQRHGRAEVFGAFHPDVDGAVQRFDLDVACGCAQ